MKQIYLSIVTVCLAILLVNQPAFSQSPRNRISFQGTVAPALQAEKVIIRLWKDVPDVNFVVRVQQTHRHFIADVQHGSFQIDIDSVDGLQYMDMRFLVEGSEITAFSLAYVLPGDRIKFNATGVHNREIVRWKKIVVKDIAGAGAAKYRIRYGMADFFNGLNETVQPEKLIFDNEIGRTKQVDRWVSVYQQIHQMIDRESGLDRQVRTLLQADALYAGFYSFFRILTGSNFRLLPLAVKTMYKDMLSTYHQRFHKDFPEWYASHSPYFSNFFFVRTIFEATVKEQPVYWYVFDEIRHQYKSLLGETLYLKYLKQIFKHMSDQEKEKAIAEGEKFIHTAKLRDALHQFHRATVGQPFPDFSLVSFSGDTVRLADLIGKVVLYDFYFTGCGGCISYYRKAVKPAEDHFKNNDQVRFVSISIDDNMDTWHKGIAAGIYNSEHSLKLLTNLRGSAHPLINTLYVSAYPYPVLTDRNGIIRVLDEKELRAGGPATLINTIQKVVDGK